MSENIIAETPKPPYVAVIFTSIRTKREDEDYAQTAEEMLTLAATMDGYLGIESARGDDGLGITTSYWRNEDDIKAWKQNGDHLAAQRAGRKRWYKTYKTRVATVTRDYGSE